MSQPPDGPRPTGEPVDPAGVSEGDRNGAGEPTMAHPGPDAIAEPPEPDRRAVLPLVPGVRIENEIGRGGFATVYRAHQVSVNRTVAVKVDDRRLLDARDRRRFTREIVAAGAVSEHPNIVTLYDGGTTADAHPYLVMEYYRGGSYSERMRSVGPVPVPEVLDVGFAIADALVAAHEVGILHRDVKPGNILISRFGTPALTDFGLAALPPSSEGYSVTMDSLTPSYAAPEAFGGATPTASMDIYALGATLYAMAKGRSPHSDEHGNSPPIAKLLALLNEPLPALDNPAAADLMPVIWRATASEPADRYRSAAALRDALAAVRAGRPQAAGGIRPSAGVLHQPGPDHDDPSEPSGGRSTLGGLFPLDPSGPSPEPDDGRRRRPGRPGRTGRLGLAAAVVAAVIVALVVAGAVLLTGPDRVIGAASRSAPGAGSGTTTQSVARSDVPSTRVHPARTASASHSGGSASPSRSGRSSAAPESPVRTSPSSGLRPGQATVDPSGTTSTRPSTTSSSVKLVTTPPPVGSCWTALVVIGQLATATKVPSCAAEHVYEAYATGVLDPSTPSPYLNDVIDDPAVMKACTTSALKDYLGPSGHGTFTVQVLPPTQINFDKGNRGFWCLAAVKDAGEVTGSLRDGTG